jgi:hypothetical protein
MPNSVQERQIFYLNSTQQLDLQTLLQLTDNNKSLFRARERLEEAKEKLRDFGDVLDGSKNEEPTQEQPIDTKARPGQS